MLIAYGVDLKEHISSSSFDEIDAIAAAYTCFLYCKGKIRALGDAEEGQIIVPVLETPPNHGYEQPDLADYGYDGSHTAGDAKAPAIAKQRLAPNTIRVKYRDATEEERLPTPEEIEAIANCDVLKNPGRAGIVYCCVCGTMRVVNPQDFFQVKRCRVCQSGHSS